MPLWTIRLLISFGTAFIVDLIISAAISGVVEHISDPSAHLIQFAIFAAGALGMYGLLGKV